MKKLHGNIFLNSIGCALVAALCLISQPDNAFAAKKSTSFTTTEVNDAFYDKAWRNFQIGTKKERNDVINALKGVVRKNPEAFMAHYYLGIMISEDGSPTTALRHFETALVGFPKSADIHVRIGKILDDKNKFEEATEHYRKAIELNPNNGTALSRVGIAELERGNNDQAYELLVRARQHEPDNPATLRGLGSILTETGNKDEAVKILEQALLFDQKHAETHWLLARAYESLRKPEKASEHYELARKYGRRDPEVKELIGYDLARSLMKAGKYNDAESEFKKAIRKSDDPGTGYYELGMLYSDIGRDDDAIKNLIKAYEEDRQFGAGIMKAASIYMYREDYGKAEEMYEMLKRDKNYKDQAKQALKDLEDRKNLNEQLALEAKLQQSRLNDATIENTYFELLDRDSKNEEALEGLWRFYEERGYYKDAITYFRKYNRIRPVSDYQKKLTEKELKDKWKAENNIIFGSNNPIEYRYVKTSTEDLLQIAEYGENDRIREEAMNILVYRIGRKGKDRNSWEDKPVLEKQLEFYEERGRLKEALKVVTRLKRYGWYTDYEAKETRRELREDLKE
jgi:tetratricopeptide (TPR) repeat protein